MLTEADMIQAAEYLRGIADSYADLGEYVLAKDALANASALIDRAMNP